MTSGFGEARPSNVGSRASAMQRASAHQRSSGWDGDPPGIISPQPMKSNGRSLASMASVDTNANANAAASKRHIYQTRMVKPLTFVSNSSASPLVDEGNMASRWISKPWFELAIGVIIGINSVTIGLEQHLRITNQESSQEYQIIDGLENVFIAIYIVELSLRFSAYGWSCFRDNWVVFDAILVVFGVLTKWILDPLQTTITLPLLARLFRLFRLARMVKLLVKFRVLWMLVQGLLGSVYTMLYTLIVLGIMLYLFAAIAMELIRMHPVVTGETAVRSEEGTVFREIAIEKFPNLPIAMLTLLQFVMQDSVHPIYAPLIIHVPYLGFYFIFVIIVLSMVLVNLLTAVIVNSAFEQASQDKEAARHHEDVKKLKLLKDLRKMFKEIDDDGDGVMTREEILRMPPKELRMLEELTNETDPLDIFDALDADSSGEVTVEEFCEGIWHIATARTPIEIKKMQKQVDLMQQKLKNTERFQREMMMHVTDAQIFQATVLEALGIEADRSKKASASIYSEGLTSDGGRAGGDDSPASDWKRRGTDGTPQYFRNFDSRQEASRKTTTSGSSTEPTPQETSPSPSVQAKTPPKTFLTPQVLQV